MPTLEQKFEEYVQEALGVVALTRPWEAATRLPAFLVGRYRYARAELQGLEILLLIDEKSEQDSPATIRKHLELVHAKYHCQVVYLRDRVTAYNRKRLIEQRIPFVIPGNQMYLPELGLDLREYFRSPSPSKRHLRPATQAMFLFALLKEPKGPLTAADFLPQLGYSTMTLSRAFDELETVELAESKSMGRKRVLRFLDSPRETWKRALPWLIDPVKARHFVPEKQLSRKELRASQSALARLSMISEPRKGVVAVSHRQWSSLRSKENLDVYPAHEDHTVEVEVWKYEPRGHLIPGVVEPLSLYLSLRKTKNERVEQALDKMMEQLRW